MHAELTREEKERVDAGGAVFHKSSAADFLILGLDIEDSQCVYFAIKLSGMAANTT